ncbi:MAG: twin-arginine translocase subunit TatC [Candidatus Rifleibacteriota bacterium]
MLEGETKEGTLVEHLEELRWVIIRVLISVCVLFPLVFYYSDHLLTIILKKLCPPGLTLKFFSPVEPLLVKLKVSFYGALFIAAPYILWQLWGFVAPGLYKRERAIAGSLLFVSWLLFVLGGFFAVFIILPLVMNFSVGFETVYLQAAIGIGNFVSLVLMLVLAFGLMFQFPPVVFVVVRTGLVSLTLLKSCRSFVFVIILTLSALLTPPDVFSQLLMGIPSYLLFELGLLAASFANVSRNEGEEEPDINEEEKDKNSTGNEDEFCEKIYKDLD